MAVAADAQFHVLAVDDSLLDRKLIERLLRTSSYQVTTVDSGRKALELLGLQGEQATSSPVSSYPQEIRVNLVITDYCMPGMTGYDLLKKIKESSLLKNIPVVIMSSENVPSRINRCLEEGAEEFFLKPVKLADMKRLRPHILKGKSNSKDQQPPQEEDQKPQSQHPAEEQKPQSMHPPEETQQQDNHVSSVSITAATISTPKNCSGNKRKARDEEISPERTRPNYNGYGLTAVVQHCQS